MDKLSHFKVMKYTRNKKTSSRVGSPMSIGISHVERIWAVNYAMSVLDDPNLTIPYSIARRTVPKAELQLTCAFTK